MAANSQLLSLVISAVDKASGVLGGISAKIGGLGSAAGAAAAKSGNLSDSIAAGMVKAQVAVNAVTMGYQKLTGAIQQASNIELENLNAASGLEAFVGDYDKAVKMVSSISKDLAKAAGPLPGSTGEYVSIFRNLTDDVGNAFKGADGKIANLAEYEKTLKSLSISFGAINATGDKNIGNMQLGLSRLLNGASLKEVFSINSIGNNVRLKTALEDAVKASGKDLQKMTDAERVKLLEKVGSSLITPQYLARAQNTLDAMWQSFISGLFDSQGGLFGVLRDLDEKMDGDQNVYESAKKTVSLIIGADGLFEQIGGIMAALGLSVDPMRVLRDGADQLNGFLTVLKGMFQGMKLGLEGGASLETVLTVQLKNLKSSIFDFFGRIFAFDPKSFGEIGQTLGYNLSASVNRGLQWLNTIDWAQAFTNVGRWLADAIDVAFTALAGFLAGVDWGAVAQFLLKIGEGLVRGIWTFLGSLDWNTYAMAAGAIALSIIIPGITTMVGGALAAFVAGTAGLPILLIVAAGFMIGSLVGIIIKNWETISAMAGEFFSGMGQAIKGFVDLAMGILTLNGPLIVSGLTNLFQGVTGWLQKAQDTWATLTGGKTTGQIASQNAFEQADADYRAKAAAKGVAVTELGGIVEPKFAGHVPNAANGLIAAAQAEAKAMPTGARVVVANDSETIIPQGKTIAGNRGGNTFYFNITGDNPDAIANKVMARIQQAFESELNAQLA